VLTDERSSLIGTKAAPAIAAALYLLRPQQPSQPHYGDNGPPQQHPGLPTQMGDTTGMVAIQPESYFQFKYIVGASLVIIIAYFIYKYRKTISKTFKGEDRVLPSISTSFL
jgi:hypothetical protein